MSNHISDLYLSRRHFIALAALLGVGMVGCPHQPPPVPPLPTPPSQSYIDAIVTFYSGVAALEGGDNKSSPVFLTRFTQMVPQEPAGWANLGLVNLRAHQLDLAASQLEKARNLAPEAQSGPILMLLGLVESQRGRVAEAIADYRRVTELEPHNLRAKYALAEAIDQQGGNNADADRMRVIEAICAEQPDNLAALIEIARLAVKQGDMATVRTYVARLKAISTTWSPKSKGYLRQVEASINDPHALTTNIAFLKNVLVAEVAFRESMAALKNPNGETQGDPVDQLYKLQTPVPTPAPPDKALTFAAGPLPGLNGGNRWAWVGATVLVGALGMDTMGIDGSPIHMSLGGAYAPMAQSMPVTIVADGRTVRIAAGASLAFPGGDPTPPLPDGIALCDWNNDFRIDLALAGAGGLKLYQQTDSGAFQDVTARAKLPTDVVSSPAVGVWPADVDLDGDLDLIVAPQNGPLRLLRNNNDGTFLTLPLFPDVSDVGGFAWGDLDSDGAPDAALLDANGVLHVFTNERSGQFLPWPVPTTLGKLVAITIADIDSDSRMDLLALQADGALLRLSGKPDRAGWDVVEIARWQGSMQNMAVGTVRLIVADLDNNGAVDIIASGPAGSQAWLADEKGAFAPLAMPSDLRVLAAADLTGNGRLDLLGITKSGAPVRAANQGTKNYHWQTLHPQANPTPLHEKHTGPDDQQNGSGDQRINSFTVGGQVTVRAGLLTQTQPILGPTVHFGLGENPSINYARFIWPNGTPQAEFELQGAPQASSGLKNDLVVLTVQRLHGSCPWVFAYDGKTMNFIGDFLWRSPLGLRINAQDTAGVAMTQEWIKIRGDQLAPRDGYYDIRITAELWETHFFDYVALMTVDHPKGTDIFVDERFAIPPPPLKVYATTMPQPVACAVDDRGTDVQDIIRARDGRYLDTFGRGDYQGITRNHYVEAEVDASAPKTGPLYLIATGWIHPTNSSINVAISQGKHERPRGLSLEVADGKGGWIVAKPNLGFPAGKVKSILVRLDDAFRPGAPRRFRLRTNLEIYWDALEVAAGLPDTTFKTQRLLPQTAELRYRGFSVVNQANPSSPELPDYQQLAYTGQHWRDLIGYYTRFGDVRELLRKIDDRYVIMNAGDELAFRFPVPPAPPAGWVRDFVLIGDGWEKDGDLNTRFSKTVLPLPSHDNPAYNRPPTRLEDDPVYRRYPQDWQNYHTRYVTPDAFQNALYTARSQKKVP